MCENQDFEGEKRQLQALAKTTRSWRWNRKICAACVLHSYLRNARGCWCKASWGALVLMDWVRSLGDILEHVGTLKETLKFVNIGVIYIYIHIYIYIYSHVFKHVFCGHENVSCARHGTAPGAEALVLEDWDPRNVRSHEDSDDTHLGPQRVWKKSLAGRYEMRWDADHYYYYYF